MNDFYLLRSLRAWDALWVLSDTVDQGFAGELDRVRIKVFAPDESPHLARAMLIVPNRPCGETMLNAYRARTGIQDAAIASKIPSDAHDLQTGIKQLLALPRTDDPPAEVAESHYLVVAEQIGVEAAQRLLTLIASHATQVNFATAHGPDGELHLYHVLADRTRNESFTSLVRDQMSALVLEGFKVDRPAGAALVFADGAYAPGRKTLTAFTKLIDTASEQVIGSGQKAAEASFAWMLLAAFIRRSQDATNGHNGTSALDILDLRHLQFSSQITLARPVVPPSDVRFIKLETDPACMAALRQKIEDSSAAQGVTVGYHLRLSRTAYIADASRERDRLLEQKEQIEQKLEYLDGTEQPRPKLFRFTHAQLPALADFVRSFPMRLLNKQGPLRYAFQSTQPDGTGVHFLLVDPRHAPQTSIDPLPFWEHHGDPIIRFWLDPFWARHYLGEGEELIYVPEGTHLLPVMHAPTKQDMSNYMRAVMQRWCRPAANLPTIPQQPIYVFEPDPDEPLHLVIAVLDRQAFQPLTERLDWLNQHLHIREVQKDGADILTKLSEVFIGDHLLNAIDEHARERDEARMRSFMSSADHVDQAAADLTGLLTNQLQEVLHESQETLAALQAAREQLQQLYSAKAQVQALHQQLSDTMDQTRAASNAAAKETGRLESEVQTQVTLTETAHDAARKRIEQLERLYTQLRNRLQQP